MPATPLTDAELFEHLRKDFSTLQEHLQYLEKAAAERDALKNALAHVFPYATYRGKKPELTSLSDSQLMEHFVIHGINEGVSLKADLLNEEVQQLRTQAAEDTARVRLLKERSQHTAEQLELLKDLFTRLNNKK